MRRPCPEILVICRSDRRIRSRSTPPPTPPPPSGLAFDGHESTENDNRLLHFVCIAIYRDVVEATERQVWRRRRTKRSTQMRGNWYGPNGPTEDEHSHGPGHGGRRGHGR